MKYDWIRGVYHTDDFYELTDQKLKFEQRKCIEKIKIILESAYFDTEDLELAVDQCQTYTDCIKLRQLNIERQQRINQLDLFNP